MPLRTLKSFWMLKVVTVFSFRMPQQICLRSVTRVSENPTCKFSQILVSLPYQVDCPHFSCLGSSSRGHPFICKRLCIYVVQNTA